MNMRTSTVLAVLVTLACGVAACANATTQSNSAMPAGAMAGSPARAIRRDIPMTNMIRRAFAAGTRDSTGRPGRKYWQTQTEYNIDARFDPATRMVTGSETIVIHNNSDQPMNDVAMRLDQNIFAANALRAEQVSEITDGMKVTKLSYNGSTVDLAARPQRLPARQAGAPAPTRAATTVTGLDLTTAMVQLQTPIAPHSSGTIEAEWNFRVPHADNGRGMRMGSWADSLFQVAQWYPRVAVYDDLRGWDTDPYLGPSEFYNNFGHFDMRITAPAGWLIGATGVLENPQDVLTADANAKLAHVLESDAQQNIVNAAQRGPGQSTASGPNLTWHFVADSVADVAWATSDRFVFDATRANIPGKGLVPIYIFYEPGHTAGFSSVGARVRHALEFYSKLWMPYSWTKETVVDGPENGMEYPNFIMSGAGAADHETGHQWWPMMVGVNETWYGFMDEGFNQYMNVLSAVDNQDTIKNSMMPMPSLSAMQRMTQPRLNGAGQSYGQISGNEGEAPLMWDANYGGPLYSFQAYGKAPMMLSMLGGIVGDSAVQRAMSEYATAWRFKHPSPWDYAFFMSNALHRDLGWFWNYWLFTTESVDGSIQNVVTNGEKTVVTVREDGQMPSPVVLKVQFAPTGKAITPMSNATMIDANTAIVTYPVDVWFGGNRTFTATLDFGGRAIQTITFDPFGRFPDRIVTDNVWPRVAAPAAPAR